MFIFNLFFKKFNKTLLSINELIESFFNRFNKNKKQKRHNQFFIIKIKDNKIILGAGILIILTLSYFLIPTFYDQDKIKYKFKNQILSEYNLEVKFNEKLRYGLFPKPHFFTKDLLIEHNQNEFANSKHVKIYISINDFLSFDKIKIKDLFLKKTEFNTNSLNINFFYQTMNSIKSEYKIIFKDSVIFYRDKSQNIIFLLKANSLKFLYNKKTLVQKMLLNYEIFNTPFKLVTENDLKKKKIFSTIKSKKIRLNIENEYDYNKKNFNGISSISIMRNSRSFNYEIKDNYFSFSSTDDNFKGKIDFRPFYLDSDLRFKVINLKKLFFNNSILINLIKTEILNNQNLNARINIQSNKVNEINYLNNLNLKLNLSEGNISIKDSYITWYDSVIIELNDAFLIIVEDDIKLIGEINFDFDDLSKFYSYYQIKRNHRVNIKNISLDFIFNLNQKKIILDNLKIDNVNYTNVNDFLSDFNFSEENIFNKVRFRNFVKSFFINFYDG